MEKEKLAKTIENGSEVHFVLEDTKKFYKKVAVAKTANGYSYNYSMVDVENDVNFFDEGHEEEEEYATLDKMLTEVEKKFSFRAEDLQVSKGQRVFPKLSKS